RPHTPGAFDRPPTLRSDRRARPRPSESDPPCRAVVADLTAEEAADLGPLLKQASGCTQELSNTDQVYVCLWSHSGWVPGHIHFVVQPAWNDVRDRYSGPSPVPLSPPKSGRLISPEPGRVLCSFQILTVRGRAAAKARR